MMSFANQQFVFVLALYGFVVLLPYFIFCHAPLKALAPWKMRFLADKKTRSHEIGSTLRTLVIIYVLFILMGFLQQKNLLHLRSDLSTVFYLLSFPLIVLVHDAYFYWTHYLMHKSKFFYQFHKTHHLSSSATPLDVLAFHPIEAFIHFIFFVIYPLIIPAPIEVLQFMFVWMIVCNSAGHLPYEFYPKFLYDFPVIKQFNAATHHQKVSL